MTACPHRAKKNTNHLFLEAASSALFTPYETPAPAAAKPMALPPAMRAEMGAANGKIPPFCLVLRRLLFFGLHRLFRSAFLRTIFDSLGKNECCTKSVCEFL